jgi:hypothetical protein
MNSISQLLSSIIFCISFLSSEKGFLIVSAFTKQTKSHFQSNCQAFKKCLTQLLKGKFAIIKSKLIIVLLNSKKSYQIISHLFLTNSLS